MKKNIILVLTMLLLVCGCSEKKENVKNDETNKQPEQSVSQRQKVFKDKAVEIYRSFETKKENVGYYFTPLSVVLRSSNYDGIFDNCNQDNTYISYEIYEKDYELITELKLVLDCEDEKKTYFYTNLNDETPKSVW